MEAGRSAVHERLRRLLFLVPFVAKHPGIAVEELARAQGLSTDELLEDLDLLAMVGRPPFQPDDYIDIYVENGRVHVDLDQRFHAPPRLTASEAAALTSAAELMRGVASQALQSALAKLEKVVPPGAVGRWREMGQKLDLSLEAPSELGPLSRAIVERREVELDYLPAGGQRAEERTVRPLELFSHRGQWYLYAHCLSRGDDRLFRLDRIRELALTERRFEASPRKPSSIPSPVGGKGEVRVRFSPLAARYVKERFGEEARLLPDGGVEVKVAGDSERWLVQWVMSFGGDAEVVEPMWARRAVAAFARASLES
ncbi:MAG: WYL domain-containing protein [Myxococcales bacterium]|nr:WYL domain-containing protein [Myxococcales bacterium]